MLTRFSFLVQDLLAGFLDSRYKYAVKAVLMGVMWQGNDFLVAVQGAVNGAGEQ